MCTITLGLTHSSCYCLFWHPQEVIEGYSEEVRSGNKAAAQAAQPPENAGRVPLHNTKEGMQVRTALVNIAHNVAIDV